MTLKKFGMTKIQNVIGIDISKTSFNTSSRRIVSGKAVNKVYSYNAAGMKEFVSRIPSGSVCVMEATGNYHCALAYYLHENGVAVSVVNPLVSKNYARMLMRRTKTDKADASLLMEYGEHITLFPWKPAEPYQVELKQLYGMKEFYANELTKLKNKREALLASPVVNEFCLREIEEEIANKQKRKKATEREMEKIVKEKEPEAYKNVMTIPGIGKNTALILIATTNAMKNFSNSSRLSSYYGVCPRIFDSGTSVKGKAKICKMGMGRVRKALYMCAITAKRLNKACRELYNRLIEKGKPKIQAIIAVANRLIRQAYAIITENTVYHENIA